MRRLAFVAAIIGFALPSCAQVSEVPLPLPAKIEAVEPKVELHRSARRSFDEYQRGPRRVTLSPNHPDFKAFAVDPNTGSWGRSWGGYTPREAIDRAFRVCRKWSQNCELYAVGNIIVSGMPPDQVEATIEEYLVAVADALGLFPSNISRLGSIYEEEIELVNPMVPKRGIVGEILSTDEIMFYISGSTVEATFFNGLRIIVEWSQDGTMSAKAGMWYDLVELGLTDKGSWSVKNDKLCRQWQQWARGKMDCLVVAKDGETFRAYDSEGKLVSKFIVLERPYAPGA